MKKILISFIVIACAFAVNAQEVSPFDAELKYNEYQYTWPNSASTVTTQTLTVTDSIWYFTVKKLSAKPLKFDAYLDFDSTGGTANIVTVKIQGKKFNETAWVDLKQATWLGGKDTTKVLTELTTAGQYQYYRAYIIGANNTFLATIKKFIIKFWE
jgi:predicted ester cyclase